MTLLESHLVLVGNYINYVKCIYVRVCVCVCVCVCVRACVRVCVFNNFLFFFFLSPKFCVNKTQDTVPEVVYSLEQLSDEQPEDDECVIECVIERLFSVTFTPSRTGLDTSTTCHSAHTKGQLPKRGRKRLMSTAG